MVESQSLTLREAALAVLVSAVTADSALAPEEAARLNALIASMRLYRQVEPEHQQRLVNRAMELVSQNRPEDLLTACASVVPAELRAPLFAIAVDLVFVDGRVDEREKRFVDALQAAFGIDDQTATNIIAVLLMKSRA
jgi:hypothetical protein